MIPANPVSRTLPVFRVAYKVNCWSSLRDPVPLYTFYAIFWRGLDSNQRFPRETNLQFATITTQSPLQLLVFWFESIGFIFLYFLVFRRSRFRLLLSFSSSSGYSSKNNLKLSSNFLVLLSKAFLCKGKSFGSFYWLFIFFATPQEKRDLNPQHMALETNVLPLNYSPRKKSPSKTRIFFFYCAPRTGLEPVSTPRKGVVLTPKLTGLFLFLIFRFFWTKSGWPFP